MLRALTIVALALVADFGSARAADTVLLIGNTNYKNAKFRSGNLIVQATRTRGRNPIEALASAYRETGFDVIAIREATAAQMQQSLRQFEQRLSNSETVVVHFYGHTVSSGATTWLVPSDLKSQSVVDLHFTAPTLDLVFDLVSRPNGPKRATILLGATVEGIRIDNLPPPAKGSIAVPPNTTLIAGRPRQINRFVAADLLSEKISIAEAKRRYPELAFFGKTPNAPIVRGQGVAIGRNASEAETRLWGLVESANTVDAYRSYLDQYPQGAYAAIARNRLGFSKPRQPERDPRIVAAEATENQIGLRRADRRMVQSVLTALGYDTKGVDGIFGRGTRSALSRWQNQNGFEVSGYLTQRQYRALQNEKSRIDRTRRAQERERNSIQETALWKETVQSGTEQAYRDFLDRYPVGPYTTAAKAKLDQFANQRNIHVEREKALGLNDATRIGVEQRLNALKLKPGRVDGTFTRETRQAIAAFQRSKKMPATGYLNKATVQLLVFSAFFK